METLDPRALDGCGAPAGEEGVVAEGSSSVLASGDVIAGRYRLVDPLGEGGMGTVWRAHCLALDIDVAVKVLHGDDADATCAARLLQEARATARLGHPCIVRALDFGEMETGEPFLVMELLEGTSLTGWLKAHGGRVSPLQAVQVLLPVADALAAAHAQGVIHRDIKPDNILVVPDGPGAFLPKIVDFGIAKVADPRGRPVLTGAGTILGSLAYMSPEQANGGEASAQTDVWGLCVVLYELVTGKSPFDTGDRVGMIFALQACAPVPTTRYGVGDDALWGIIERGLQRSSHDRWSSMRALGCALASWAAARGLDADITGAPLAGSWLPAATGPADLSPLDRGPQATTLRIPPKSLNETATPRAEDPSSSNLRVYTKSIPPAPRRRRWALALGAVLAAALAPMAWLATHRGCAIAGDPPQSAVEHPASAAEAMPEATASMQEAPSPVQAPSAAPVEDVAPPPAASAPRPARVVRPSRAPSAIF